MIFILRSQKFMLNKDIKIGIIGMGRMGITHFSIINSHPSVNIVATAEPSKLISIPGIDSPAVVIL